MCNVYCFSEVRFFSRPTPNLDDQGGRFVWPLSFAVVYAHASIAVRVIRVRKPHHPVKVAARGRKEKQSMEERTNDVGETSQSVGGEKGLEERHKNEK